MKNWQFNILFFVGVGGAVFLLFAPQLGFSSSQNPTALTGIGAILTYVLTQKKSLLNGKKKPSKEKSDEEKPRRLSDIDDVYRDVVEEDEYREQARREEKTDG